MTLRALALSLLAPLALTAQQPAPPDPAAVVHATAADAGKGKGIFEVQCVRCHGYGATGGVGPALTNARLPHAPDDSTLFTVIQQGIPGTAMAGDWSLTDPETFLVAAYIRSLGRVTPTPLSGDSGRGQALYVGKGGCAACHILAGGGSGFGPDLTGIGDRRGAAYLRTALERPGAEPPQSPLAFEPSTQTAYLWIRAVTRDDTEVTGLRINEDGFTVQIRDSRGVYHSLRKSDLRSLDKRFGESPMPSFGAILSSADLNDLVAFLAKQRDLP